MNSIACGLRVASVVSGLISLTHLVRLFLRIQIVIGSYPAPLWMSSAAVVVFGLLSFWFGRLSRSAQPAASVAPSAA